MVQADTTSRLHPYVVKEAEGGVAEEKKGLAMSTKITISNIHHIRLIVTDPVRSRDFYTSLLNFTVAAELPPGFVLTNGSILLGMTLPWDPNLALPNDHFSPHRVGLDHLSFSVASREDLIQ